MAITIIKTTLFVS